MDLLEGHWTHSSSTKRKGGIKKDAANLESMYHGKDVQKEKRVLDVLPELGDVKDLESEHKDKGSHLPPSKMSGKWGGELTRENEVLSANNLHRCQGLKWGM